MKNSKSFNASTETSESFLREGSLKNALDKLIEGMQIIDFNWRYIYVNEALVKQSHYTKGQMLGHTVMELYPGVESTPLFKTLKECMETRNPAHQEVEFEFPSKEKTWFELSIQPTSEGIFILSVDISERKKAQDNFAKLNSELESLITTRTSELELKIQQLRESEEKFQKAFHASSAGMSITRLSDSTYVDVNDAFVKLTEFDRQEIIGRTSTQLGLVTDITQRENVLSQVKADGFAKNIELTVRTKSGKLIVVLTSIESIVLNGESYALNILYDITDRKKSEEQLRALNRELEAFTYSVSHDLRAPLRSIIGYAEILKEELQREPSHVVNKALQVVVKNANRMNRLIDDLLALSKLDRTAVQKSTVNTGDIVQSCINAINSVAPYNETKIDVKPLHECYGDAGLIYQVWYNLISNALKYSSKKEKPFVEIGSDKAGSEVTFYVKDNGTGFDMRYADKLFVVFQRLHKQQDYEGTGVGLAIAHRIISRHGGRIWAESTEGAGATFYFTIPGEM